VEDAMIKKFGNRNSKTNKWHGISIKPDEFGEGDNEMDELNH